MFTEVLATYDITALLRNHVLLEACRELLQLREQQDQT